MFFDEFTFEVLIDQSLQMKKEMLYLFSLFSIILACTNPQNTDNHSVENYPPTLFPSDTSQLWIADGNLSSDTAVIICQGGPDKDLTMELYGRTSYRYLPGYNNYSIAYLHQAQTYNKEIFNYQKDFSPEMAQKEVANTTEMLHRAISYFKKRHKYTIVIGKSYGAFVITNYLSEKNPEADRYLVCAGRIDVNLEMVREHIAGVNGGFGPDGLSYLPYEKEDLSQFSEAEIKEEIVQNRLKGAIGKTRYSKALVNKDLSKLSYFYADDDQNVGALTPSEIDFLKSKNVPIYRSQNGHGEALYRMIDALLEGKVQY